jgi:hypothetical protein
MEARRPVISKLGSSGQRLSLMRDLRPTIILLLTIAFVVGCGGGGPKTSKVKGQVTLDGAPLEEGNIVFIPTDGKGVTSGGKITKGEYTADVPYGEKRIEIRARKVVGTKPAYEGVADSPMQEIAVELIPLRYNSESVLVWTIDSEASDVNIPMETAEKAEEKK